MLQKITDGFKNILKGLGTSKDPRQNTYYQQGMRITQKTANDLYVYNWLAAKVVDIPIDDATRKWRNLLISDADEKKEIETLMQEFEIKTKINQAAKWARVFGGAVIIAIIDGEDPAEPLIVDQIRPGTLKNFIVLDRWNIYPGGIDRDITSKNFSNPEYYTVARNGQNIHHTRLTKLSGDTSTLMELELQNFWGNSIFTKQLEPITDSQVTSQSIADLIYESNVDVYRINGLNGLVAEGQDEIVIKRLKIASEMKSILNAVVLDKEDEYEKKTNTFTTLPDIDDRFIQKVAGASDIPVTRLLGVSPTGMNATGESDMLNYYDNVQSIQENDLRPPVSWMDSVICANAGLPLFEYEFLPLKQLTEAEQADVNLKRAQTNQIYLDQGVITEVDTLTQLAEDGTYISIDEIRVDQIKSELELENNFGEEED